MVKKLNIRHGVFDPEFIAFVPAQPRRAPASRG
jgi:hypothetical protein